MMTRKRVAVAAAMLFSLVLSLNAGTIPQGAKATVRINTALSSGTAHKEEAWTGTLTSNISSHGKVVAHAGDSVKGKVTYVKPSGRLKDPGVITLRLTSINGQSVYSSSVSHKGKSHTGSNAAKIGGGAAGGALIGGLLGGGKGAAIGAGAGAAGGTGVAAATGKKEAVIPAESVLTFTITGSK
jgi:hypothetical protein